MSTQGKGKTTLKKLSEKKSKVKKDPKPIETAFSKALTARLKDEPRMFAMSSLRKIVRGDFDEDGSGNVVSRRKGGLMITGAAAKMLNSEIVGSTSRIIRETLVFSRKKRSVDGSRMHVFIDPGPLAFGAISLGALPESMNTLPYVPDALNENEEEEIRLAYVTLTKQIEKTQKAKKCNDKSASSSPKEKKKKSTRSEKA